MIKTTTTTAGKLPEKKNGCRLVCVETVISDDRDEKPVKTIAPENNFVSWNICLEWKIPGSFEIILSRFVENNANWKSPSIFTIRVKIVAYASGEVFWEQGRSFCIFETETNSLLGSSKKDLINSHKWLKLYRKVFSLDYPYLLRGTHIKDSSSLVEPYRLEQTTLRRRSFVHIHCCGPNRLF